MVESYYDRVSKSYDREYSNSYMKLYDAITWHNIKKYPPKDRNSLVMDAGGGTGRWAIPIAKLSYKVVMADISKGMLDVARKKVERMNLKNIEFMRMNIREMAFEDETFDFVLAQGDSVSYCGDPEKALSEIFRVLKRGCFASISVDSKFSMALKFLLKDRIEELEGFLETGKILFPLNTKEDFETRAFGGCGKKEINTPLPTISMYRRAKADLRYLLNRNYKKKYALDFVCNHYKLKKRERYLLARSTFSDEEILKIESKKKPIEEMRGRRLLIDGYNVLITTEAVLEGEYVVCDDTVIRDVRGVFGRYEIRDMSFRALDEILEIVKDASSVEFIFDEQVSKSGELCHILRKRGFEAKTTKHVDLEIIEKNILTATSDSLIIKSIDEFVDIPDEVRRAFL